MYMSLISLLSLLMEDGTGREGGISDLEYPWNFGSSSILEEVTVTSEYKLSTKVFKEKKSLSGRMTKVSPQHAGGWSTRHWDYETPDVTCHIAVANGPPDDSAIFGH